MKQALTGENLEKIRKSFQDRSCKNCGHIRVCSVYRGIKPLLSKSFTEETKPFHAEDLASICNEFIPASLLSALQNK